IAASCQQCSDVRHPLAAAEIMKISMGTFCSARGRRHPKIGRRSAHESRADARTPQHENKKRHNEQAHEAGFPCVRAWGRGRERGAFHANAFCYWLRLMVFVD